MINLNYGYYIEIDRLNYTLKQNEKIIDKKGQEKEVTRIWGYFGNLRKLIERYLELCQKDMIADSDVSMMEYVEMVERSNEMAVQGLESVLKLFPVK